MLKRLLKVLTSGSSNSGNGALNSEFNTDDAGSSLIDGVNLHRTGRLLDAERVYENILNKSPQDPNALHLLSIIQSKKGNLDRAEELARLAVATTPELPEYLNTLASIVSEMGRPQEAVDLLRRALLTSPNALRPRSNLLFLLNLLPGLSRRELFREHLEWAKIHASRAEIAPLPSARFGADRFAVVGRRLRIGYVSADLRAHPVGRILRSVLPFHDLNSFEIVCYDNTREPDALNRELRLHAHAWREIHGMEDVRVAELIVRDGIDVLVDLSGHTHGGRLAVFAMRPAPVQATWLGYLNTSGMAQIDWRLTCRLADPEPLASETHSERLWYLPDCIWPWQPAAEWYKPGRDNASSNAKQGNIIFGSFNTFRKINPEVIHAWARILAQVPHAWLKIFGVPRGATLDRIMDLFEWHGIGGERVQLFGSADHDTYHRAFSGVDIALDPFPYSGGATTCECLWMGVPVVTLAGEGGFSRTSASLLNALGLEHLVASDLGDYVGKAVDLARDRQQVEHYHRTLRERIRASPLMDANRFVRNIEASYIGMWQSGRHRAGGKECS